MSVSGKTFDSALFSDSDAALFINVKGSRKMIFSSPREPLAIYNLLFFEL